MSFEVFVVDNNSQDGTAEMIREKFPQVKLINNKDNAGFPKANNQAILKSSGRYILLLNPDTVVHPGALDKLVEFMDQHPDAGAAGPKLLWPNGRLQESCISFPTIPALLTRSLFIEGIWPNNPITKKHFMKNFKYDKVAEVDQPMGAALIIRKKALDKVGLMDEKIKLFFDEVDLCYRIKKAGWKIYFTPDPVITHFGGQSVKKLGPFGISRQFGRSRNYYFRKHFGIFAMLIIMLGDLLGFGILLGIIFIIFIFIKKLL